MELRQLRSFLVVAQELSFTKAAARLQVAQPPLTQQIHRLEADLGVRLFERTTRRVTLTAAGEALQREMSVLLPQFDDAIMHLREVAAGRHGRIAIGFIEPAGFEVVPATVKAFRLRYPDIEIVLKQLTSLEQIEALRQHAIQIGFLRRQPTIRRDISMRRIRREPLAVITSGSHPLARSNAPIHLSELAHEDFVMIQRSADPVIYDALEDACRRAGFSLQRAQVASHLNAVLSLVAARCGITFAFPAVAHTPQSPLHVRPLADKPALISDLHVAWLADQVTPVMKNFLDVAVEVNRSPILGSRPTRASSAAGR